MQLTQQLMARALGHDLAKLPSEVDGRVRSVDPFVEPAGSEKELRKAEQHVALRGLGARLVEMLERGTERGLGSRDLTLFHQQQAQLVLTASEEGVVVLERV